MKNHEVANQSMVVSQKLLTEVNNSIVIIRDVPVIADADVAALYDVETKRVNEAVRNNPNKFPNDYMFELSLEENKYLRSKISSTKVSSKSRTTTKVFTEKGLYMLATINKIPLTTNQACCNLQINSEIALYKYVYYYLSNKYEYVKSLGQGSQTNISAKIVKNLQISIPPLSE